MKQLLTLITLLFAIAVQAQMPHHIEFDYDQAGNRIARRIVYDESLSQQIKGSNQAADSIIIKNGIGNMEVKVYPNPTRGQLGVEITGADQSVSPTISIYSGTGTLVYQQKAETGINQINLTDYPAGWYILQLKVGDTKSEYKIIKK